MQPRPETKSQDMYTYPGYEFATARHIGGPTGEDIELSANLIVSLNPKLRGKTLMANLELAERLQEP